MSEEADDGARGQEAAKVGVGDSVEAHVRRLAGARGNEQWPWLPELDERIGDRAEQASVHRLRDQNDDLRARPDRAPDARVGRERARDAAQQGVGARRTGGGSRPPERRVEDVLRRRCEIGTAEPELLPDRCRQGFDQRTCQLALGAPGVVGHACAARRARSAERNRESGPRHTNATAPA